MASLPGYLRAEGKPYMRDGECCQNFAVLPWHPSMLAEIWRLIDAPVWAKPVLAVVVWLRVMRIN